jgi:long-chain acyl-CoA synthetase
MIERLREHQGSQTAVISCCDDMVLSYSSLVEHAEQCAQELEKLKRPALVFQMCDNDCGSITSYLACRSVGVPLALLDNEPTAFTTITKHYRPTALIGPRDAVGIDGYKPAFDLPFEKQVFVADSNRTYPVDISPQLQLMLATSGSTGNAKLVQLSEQNLNANACSIVEYLDIDDRHCSIQSLPIQYSYGLSLVNSHFWAGGTVVLTNHSILRREFWRDVVQHNCTSFAGVPYMYETLHRLGFDPDAYPTLRILTQAGGGLRPSLIEHFHEKTANAGQQFFVMYGQTEATARISYVPPEQLREKIGAIGIPIPDGRLRLDTVIEDVDSSARELIYEGPNVMLGYAESPDDLARGDQLAGVLRTGDLGSVDEDGYFYLKGRLKRMAKLYGKRINLTDVERIVEEYSGHTTAVVEGANQLVVFVVECDRAQLDEIRHRLAKSLAVPPSALRIRGIDEIPLTTSGKKDYKMLPA